MTSAFSPVASPPSRDGPSGTASPQGRQRRHPGPPARWPLTLRRRLSALVLLALAVSPLSVAAPVATYQQRSSRTDLEITGLLAGVPPDQTRFIRWSDLRNLPTRELELTGEFLPGKQKVVVLFLEELLRHLPGDAAVDAVLATCGDGYAALFTRAFIQQYRPFVVLEINGLTPEHWPPPGLTFDPGPYVITVSTELAPAAASFLDIEHKKPWGVTRLEIARFDDRFRGIQSGPWSNLSARAVRGRGIWVNSCVSCHQGPPSTFGGTKSDQPFAVLQALATCKPDFFRRYVRDPKSEIPNATMEPHPHYTDAQLDELIAFIRAEPRP